MKSYILSTLFIVFMQTYESQPYRVISTVDNVEIRFYPPATKVSVEGSLRSNSNFNALFQYISGNNSESEKIAMTTPVYMQNSEESQRMEFVLPSKFVNSDAPQPLQEDVKVYTSKAAHFAAIRFGGYSNSSKVESNTIRLMSVLKAENVEVIGEPILLSYDAPYKFYNRRNEILVEIAY